MNKLLRFGRGHAPDVVALSALLDGELDTPAAARLNEHVASCAECSATLEGVRATRVALREMPELAPARSFRLRVADVERAPVAARVPLMVRWAPAAGGIAAAVFVAVLVADLGSSSDGQRMATSPIASRESSGAAVSDGAGAKGAPAGATPVANAATAPTLALDAAADSAAGVVPPAPGPAGASEADPRATAETIDTSVATAAATEMQQYAAESAAETAPAGTLRAADADQLSNEDDGNNWPVLRVIEIIAATAALAAGAVIIGWRRRGERT